MGREEEERGRGGEKSILLSTTDSKNRKSIRDVVVVSTLSKVKCTFIQGMWQYYKQIWKPCS